MRRAIAAKVRAGNASPTSARALADRLLAAYPVPLAPPPIPEPRRAAPALYADNCASCHGAKGEGPSGEFAKLDPAPIAFADRDRARERSVSNTWSACCLLLDFSCVLLAARQGANPYELLGETAAPMASAEAPADAQPAEPAAYAGMPDWLRPGAAPELEPDALSEADAETAAPAEGAGYASLPDWLRPGAVAEPDAAQSAESAPAARAEETALTAGYDSLPDWLRPGSDALEAQPAATEAGRS